MKSILIYFATKYKGDFYKILKALKENERVSDENAQAVMDDLEQKGIQAFTVLDSVYPEVFKHLKTPPFVIFYKGNINLLKNDLPKISLVGEQYNEIVQSYLDKSLSEVIKRHTLVTNGYKGVEEKINNYFLQNQGKLIFVSANGVENPWISSKFEQNNQNILLISEYPNTNVSYKRLKNRNRLVAALSKNLIVYSSSKASGIQNLVNHFLMIGKEIFCFPGDINFENDGNTELIKQGANLITEVKDVYKEINFE
ncbi:DNA-processing protein DprA [Mycoplasma sp. 1654_15]|uniref:DNA-processing protein DprA n=1 Tax=Mycoplasma sp. 1654_15 TaxID=2725994 RepID=UPI0014492BCC|nr:DNA-processing protein DprA [Mycoplasma sp. 1654_15]QJB71126.1 DNA-processing protein DprA [Mycoplasma sp. 1654_15]